MLFNPANPSLEIIITSPTFRRRPVADDPPRLPLGLEELEEAVRRGSLGTSSQELGQGVPQREAHTEVVGDLRDLCAEFVVGHHVQEGR
jgi:hypothetical protein